MAATNKHRKTDKADKPWETPAVSGRHRRTGKGDQAGTPSSVTEKAAKPKRPVTHEEYAAMLGRMIVAMGRRAGTDPEALAYIPVLNRLLAIEYRQAGAQLYTEYGYHPQELARYLTATGHTVTRQAAQQQFSPAGVEYVTRRRGYVSGLFGLQAARIRRASTEVLTPRKATGTDG